MIVRVRFRDSVTVQGFPGEHLSISSKDVSIVGDHLFVTIHPKDDCTLETRVPISNVLWIHTGPDVQLPTLPEKKPTKKK